MKALAAFVVAIVAAVVVGVLLSREPGYVLVAYGTTRVEFTLFVFLLIYLACLLAGAAIWSLARRLQGMPAQLRRSRESRAARRAERMYTTGLVALAEGRLPVAERALEYAARGALALPALLAAARAADSAGERERRDRYLKRAWESHPKAASAVLLTQAELDLAHNDYERALATLQRLRGGRGAHPLAVRDLARVYAALHEHDKLLALLPELERSGVMPARELEALAVAAVHGALAGGKGERVALVRRLPAALREVPSVRRAAAAGYAEAGEEQRAAELLVRNVEAQYEPESVSAYAALAGIEPAARLRTLEGWLRRYGDEPALLTAAGRVALELKLWGQARSYLEQARHAPAAGPDAALLAGHIAEEEGRAGDALAIYRAGLEGATGGERGG